MMWFGFFWHTTFGIFFLLRSLCKVQLSLHESTDLDVAAVSYKATLVAMESSPRTVSLLFLS